MQVVTPITKEEMALERHLSCLLSQIRGSSPNPVLPPSQVSLLLCLSGACTWEHLHSPEDVHGFSPAGGRPEEEEGVHAGGLATASSFLTHHIPGLIWPSMSYSSDTLTHASLPHTVFCRTKMSCPQEQVGVP